MKDRSEKLNIAMVCDPIGDYIAGSFISTVRFAERLKARDHKIIFIAARSPKSPLNGMFKGMMVYRFRSVLLPKTEGLMYLAFPTPHEIQNILQEEKIDVLHVIIPSPAAVVSVRAAAALGIKIVIHSHTQPENIFLHVPRALGRAILNRVFQRAMVWLYGYASMIIYPTKFAEMLFPYLNATMKHTIISNGVDTTIYKKMDSEKFFEKYGISREKKNILFVGRLHPEKSIETLIEAASLVVKDYANAHTLILGVGHQDTKLARLAQSLGLETKITFLGKVSEEELVMAYNACDIFVLPSLAELEGMVVLEAMACGKPIVIANAKESASTYFVDNNGFLFEPKNPQDLAQKVLTLLKDDALRARMGEESFKKSKEYDISRSVTLLEDLYYSVLSHTA